jgi:hypothetical protein
MAEDTLRRLQAFAESVGKEGDIGLIWRGDEWLASAEFGREAPGSPMAGGAAYGNHPDATFTVEQMLADTHFKEGTEVQPSGVDLIATERGLQRQIWSDEHDDAHDRGEITRAAYLYVMNAGCSDDAAAPIEWPWEPEHWRPTGDRVKDLTKAGALIAAEIDRLQRAARTA